MSVDQVAESPARAGKIWNTFCVVSIPQGFIRMAGTNAMTGDGHEPVTRGVGAKFLRTTLLAG